MELTDGEDHCKEQRQAAGVDENGLPQRAPEELVKLRVALHGYHARIGGHLGRSPAVRKGLDAREGSERHTHLTGYNSSFGCKQYRIKQLEYEITTYPTQCYSPLIRENLFHISYTFCYLIPPKIYLVAPQIIIIMKTTRRMPTNEIAALTTNAIVEKINAATTITNIMKANSNKRHPHIFIPPKIKEVIDWISFIHLLLLRCIWFTFLTDYYSK